MDYTIQQLRALRDKLPEDVQEALYSVDTSDAIQRIAKSYSLHIDQMGSLADVVGDVMMGITHPRDFRSAVQKELRLDDETARQVVEETDKTIFQPIRSSLRAVHDDAPRHAMQGDAPRSKREGERAVPVHTDTSHQPVQGDAYREPIEEDAPPEATNRKATPPLVGQAPPASSPQTKDSEGKDGAHPSRAHSATSTNSVQEGSGQAGSPQARDSKGENDAHPSREDLLKEIEGMDTTPAREAPPVIGENTRDEKPRVPTQKTQKDTGSEQKARPKPSTEDKSERDLVRKRLEEAFSMPETERKEEYKSGDPYREPAQ